MANRNTSNRVLLVEGESDKHVVRRLCNRYPSFKIVKDIDHLLKFRSPESESSEWQTIDILNKVDVKQLLVSINLEIKAPGRQAVGILVDANNNLRSRWDAVGYRLGMANIRFPRSPEPAGTIIEGKPRVGIWLMPDNESSGELEDFVVQMIPDGDPVWPLSQQYIDGIPEGDRKFTEKKMLRAKLYAWLAARKNPKQMGSGIESHDLDVNGTLCQSFVDWLTALFK